MNPVARLDQVSHHYKTAVALDNVTLDIPAGCMAGFIGPDGVGKSSAMALIAGVRKIQQGDVRVLDGDMRGSAHRKAVCSRIAYMPQGLGRNLYMSLSVFENVDFFGRLFGQMKKEREWRISELLESTGLAPFRNRPAGKLSGGMKQKLGLCCALIHDPDLLILDEPTTGVDPLSRLQFWQLIDRIRSRRSHMSVLVSTAYMEEAEEFDWLAAMDAGRILDSGTPAQLMEKTGTQDLDAAFIQLLPEKKRKGHTTLTVPPRTDDKDDDIAIVAENLTKRFGDFTAVDHVNFKIKRGEIFGFLGSNGCGKTTTMKMLTGLLPPSEGKARLFGKPVKARGLEMRRRVGYMTQAFSLYAELTVKANLVLHARLFHIPKERRESRVSEMIDRFDLHSYENELAASLPLGIRQRLSLAVAVIHSPEILILDEPTSGVDPVARDKFWRLLIDLSRNDGVTIFVSTHFMNEGERCDRISLMHGGRVLASDTPAALIQSRNKTNLKDAFIDYLEEAGGGSAEPETKAIPALPPPEIRHGHGFGLSFLRMFGYAYRESLEVVRDPIRLTFALLGTVILMFIIGYGLTMDVENIRFAVLDRDQSPQSRDYIQNIAGSRYFAEQAPIDTSSELDLRMASSELTVALEIPPDFGKDLKRGRQMTVGVWIDGAMPFRAETIRGYLTGMNYDYLKQLARRTYGQVPAFFPADIETRYRYNQDFKSIYAMVPAVIPMLLVFIPAILTALGVVREKELGSITNFYATPVTRVEFLAGKQLPYVGISMISFFGLIALAVFFFGVPLKGSFWTISLGALIFVCATTGMGLMVSAFTKTQVAALAATAILTMVPSVSFSGLKDPVSSLEGAGAFIGKVFPVTYFINISRGIFSKALGFSDLTTDFIAMSLSVPVLLILSLMLLRKQEK